MTKDELSEIGRELFGSAWKAKMARALARSPATVFNWTAGRIDIPKTAADHIHRLHTEFRKSQPINSKLPQTHGGGE